MRVSGQPTRHSGKRGKFYAGVDTHQPGIYLVTGDHKEKAPSSVECPYCHSPLIERLNAENYRRIKIVDAMDKYRMLGEDVPPSHRLLSCTPCQQFFTVLREV